MADSARSPVMLRKAALLAGLWITQFGILCCGGAHRKQSSRYVRFPPCLLKQVWALGSEGDGTLCTQGAYGR